MQPEHVLAVPIAAEIQPTSSSPAVNPAAMQAAMVPEIRLCLKLY